MKGKLENCRQKVLSAVKAPTELQKFNYGKTKIVQVRSENIDCITAHLEGLRFE